VGRADAIGARPLRLRGPSAPALRETREADGPAARREGRAHAAERDAAAAVAERS